MGKLKDGTVIVDDKQYLSKADVENIRHYVAPLLDHEMYHFHNERTSKGGDKWAIRIKGLSDERAAKIVRWLKKQGIVGKVYQAAIHYGQTFYEPAVLIHYYRTEDFKKPVKKIAWKKPAKKVEFVPTKYFLSIELDEGGRITSVKRQEMGGPFPTLESIDKEDEEWNEHERYIIDEVNMIAVVQGHY